MDPYLLLTYQRHLEHQLTGVIFSTGRLNEAQQRNDVREMFYHIQNMLTSAANAAKLMWGQKGKFAAERKALRDSVGVTDDSPLKGVEMRNNYEHFDERIGRWWKETTRHSYWDMIVGPVTELAHLNLQPLEWFRHYDQTTQKIHFWGEEFDLQAMVAEADRILPVLRPLLSESRVAEVLKAQGIAPIGRAGLPDAAK